MATVVAKTSSRQAERAALLQRGTEEHYEDAPLYDLEYEDREDDVRWYRELAHDRADGHNPAILELGAGTGRVTCPLAEDGHRVIALDRMPAMLERLRQKLEGTAHADRVTVMEGDMRNLRLADASVGLVMAPFNGLMHLYAHQDLLSCFREVYRVLAPGGVFAFDVQLPDLEWLMWDPDKRHAITRFRHPTTGENLVYSTNHTYDPATQICHVRIYYDRAPPRGRKFTPPPRPLRLVHLAHRQIFPEELRGLVASADLKLESLSGDFEDLPLRTGVESQVAVCCKPRGRLARRA
jgi:ubiquinone/menaquinone biosynthesis C-methylase UbiE